MLHAITTIAALNLSDIDFRPLPWKHEVRPVVISSNRPDHTAPHRSTTAPLMRTISLSPPHNKSTLQAVTTADSMIRRNQASKCTLRLSTSGGTFHPDVCGLEIISGGPKCRVIEECRGDYAISLRDSRSRGSEISSVVLFNIQGLKTGSYRYDPHAGLAEFQGELTDRGAIARPLLGGTVALELRNSDRVHVSLDVRFHPNIRIRASGWLQIKRVSAP